MATQGYVAFDLGAESGRAMLASVSVRGKSGRIDIEEAHRFPNVMQRLPSGYHWNLVGLWGNLVEGLRHCGRLAQQRRIKLVSLGVDTWGVDYGLIGKSGQLLGLPFAYRDDAHHAAMRSTRRKLGDKRIYDATGIQFLFFNTLFQLTARHPDEPGQLQLARHLLFMPDLLHYFFSGKMVVEATIASTSQMVNPRTRRWHKPLLKAAGLPTHMLGKIVPAGTKVGRLTAAVAEEAGVARIDVIAPGGHDTASAVAAVPVDDAHVKARDWAYVSSGTWSLMGAELDKPLLTDAARLAGFTNERGVEDKIRLLKNIAGLWLVQETRRDFARRGHEYDYATLTRLAGKAPAFRTLVDPAHTPFGSPGRMPDKIAAFAKTTGQPVPRNVGEFVRCCLESLALSYRHCLESLETLLRRRMNVLHIVGGGGRNALLNQMTADAIGRNVIVGPYEATAIGNALTQAIGAGQVRDLAHLRAIVRASCKPQVFKPRNGAAFEAMYDRYQRLLGR
jgi:rhamnulokinase